MFDINTDLDLLGGLDLPATTGLETSDTAKPTDSAATGTARSTRVTANISAMDQVT